MYLTSNQAISPNHLQLLDLCVKFELTTRERRSSLTIKLNQTSGGKAQHLVGHLTNFELWACRHHHITIIWRKDELGQSGEGIRG